MWRKHTVGEGSRHLLPLTSEKLTQWKGCWVQSHKGIAHSDFPVSGSKSPNSIFKSTCRVQAVRVAIFACYLSNFLFVNLFLTPWPNKNRFGPEISYTHSDRAYLKCFCFGFYSKKSVRGPLSWRNYRVTWISAWINCGEPPTPPKPVYFNL